MKATRAVSVGIVVVAIAVVAVLLASELIPSSVVSSTASTGTPTVSSTIGTSSSSNLTETLQTTNSTLGLRLLLSVNSTTIPSEDAITISTSLVNTRSVANNLTASSDWPVQGLASGPCDLGPYRTGPPNGIAVLRGYYGMNNLSSAKALYGIWPEASCPAFTVINATSYSFLPNSDVANYSGYTVPSPPSQPAREESTTRTDFATWVYAANGTGFYGSLGSALPSNYTLVAGDEWGQLVLLHFRVTPSNNLPVVGNFLASGGGCSPGPCEAQRFSEALVFPCAAAAATTSGCSVLWSSGLRYSASPIINYTVTVWYPSYNQSGEPPWANCVYKSIPVGDLLPQDITPSFGYCLMVNSTSFVVSPTQP